MERDPIALELYTVRDRLKDDFAGTVRQVAEMGYPAVEFAGYTGMFFTLTAVQALGLIFVLINAAKLRLQAN